MLCFSATHNSLCVSTFHARRKAPLVLDNGSFRIPMVRPAVVQIHILIAQVAHSIFDLKQTKLFFCVCVFVQFQTIASAIERISSSLQTSNAHLQQQDARAHGSRAISLRTFPKTNPNKTQVLFVTTVIVCKPVCTMCSIQGEADGPGRCLKRMQPQRGSTTVQQLS